MLSEWVGGCSGIRNGGLGDDVLNGDIGRDNLLGGLGNDTLIGGAGSDTLNGGANNDVLDGTTGETGTGAQDDTLSGGDGQDRLILRPGDTGHGGAGADVFVVDLGVLGETAVQVSDFNPASEIIEIEWSGSTPPGCAGGRFHQRVGRRNRDRRHRGRLDHRCPGPEPRCGATDRGLISPTRSRARV